MTLFMPPIQRKKKVDTKYNPDTFRVISEDAITDHPKYNPKPYTASFEPRTPTPKQLINLNWNALNNSNQNHEVSLHSKPLKNTRVLPQDIPDFRRNKPQPSYCRFLDKNVRLLNEPICNVHPALLSSDNKRWWENGLQQNELQLPPYSLNTSYRSTYSFKKGIPVEGYGRHTYNKNMKPAHGCVPINYMGQKDGSKRVYKENMSYEHQYNCRSDPNYPNRGKRHGAFVWDRMDPISERKFREYYERLAEAEKNNTKQTSPDENVKEEKQENSIETTAPIDTNNNEKSMSPESPISAPEIQGNE